MLTIFLALLIAAASPADNDPCSDPAACRNVGPVTLKRPDGRSMTLPMKQGRVPWVPADNVMLFPGEAVVVRLEPETRDGFLRPVLVRGGPTAKDGELEPGQVRLVFRQAPDAALVLTVTSAYDRPLHYDAVIVSAVRGPLKTSVCTLVPGVPVIERWEGPNYQVAATNFRVQAEPGVLCR